MKKHEWLSKYLGEEKYMVCCVGCGKSAGIFPKAHADVILTQLLGQQMQNYGFNRRSRKARNSRKKVTATSKT